MNHEQQVREIEESFARHPVNSNPFFEFWASREHGFYPVALFARNFFDHVAPTIDRIAAAFARMTDPVARAMTIENLDDEIGHGRPEKAHTLLLANFLSALLSKIAGCDYPFEMVDAPELTATKQLVSEGLALFASESQHVAAGALLAQERHAYPQLVRLYEGARNYMRYFEVEEFHLACEYFYVHLGASEMDHVRQSFRVAARICVSDEDVALLSYGFTAYLDLLDAYWSALHDAMAEVAAEEEHALIT